MAVTVKRIKLWHTEVENRPGVLAGVLEPLASAGADLEMLMATSFPGGAQEMATVGVFPVTGKKATAAATAAGLSAAPAMSSLLVTGDNKVGLGRQMARTLADAGINIGLVVALVVGRNFSAVFGFESETDARKAALLLKKVGAVKKAPTKQPATKQPAMKKPATKQPAMKKPATKQPATKQPATKKPAPRRA